MPGTDTGDITKQVGIPAQRTPETAAESSVPVGEPVSAAVPSRPRSGAGIRAAWPALVLYATLRATGLITFWLVATDKHRDIWAQLSRWDARWYLGVVAHGYDTAFKFRPDGTPLPSNLAFFPLYPGLIWVTDHVLPGDAVVAGLVVSWLAAIAAAWGLFAIGTELRDRRTGVLLAALWAVIPHALIESMGYTETLFTALCAWSLFAVLRRRWLLAGLLCSFAGLTRPTGAALVAAVGLAALVAVIMRRDGWRPWIGGLLAPAGFLSYVFWVGDRLGGGINGYFRVQSETWNMAYDNGAYTLSTAGKLLTGKNDLAMVMCTIVLLIAIMLFVPLTAERRAWPLAVFALIIIAMAFFGDAYYHSKGRLLIPAFPLLLPAAAALAKAHLRTVIGVLVGLGTISAVYGVYLLLFWVHSP
ncbi:hypothetical protein ACTOB_002258 [Actinoplanes oblitus]|uniref:Glycosyltransferase RgtA/B/C/D-like domain-containing protein n=1 Tax=Actinoplanes oblitus TaxID=3040509 RepID=A0ABY8WP97_9ACTN|nr:hypothetical protein [Actinoplanes oblitus]WIM98652.1 hypothetical protein ACTOB_002258 [Actinoplanes oblitus]